MFTQALHAKNRRDEWRIDQHFESARVLMDTSADIDSKSTNPPIINCKPTTKIKINPT